MANREYDDRDDRRNRGWAEDERSGYGRQWSQSDDRSQGYGRDQRDWQGQRGDWDRNQGYGGGSQGWTGGQGFSRGGMSQSGGERGSSYGQGYGQGSSGYGRDSGDSWRSDDWRRSGANAGGWNRQAQADMGYGGFGDRRFERDRDWAGSSWDGDRSNRWGGQDLYGDRPEGRAAYDEDRFGRSRGSAGGAYGEGRRDYSDYRTDRDRSLLGEIANLLGFGSDNDRDRSRDRSASSGTGSSSYRADWTGGRSATRGSGPKGYTRSDSRIEEDVNEKLSNGWLDASDVTVAVKDGEVTLTGTVRSREDKRRAEDIADDVSGVHHVQNNLRVSSSASTAYGAGQGMGGADSQSGAKASTGQTAQAGTVRSETNKF